MKQKNRNNISDKLNELPILFQLMIILVIIISTIFIGSIISDMISYLQNKDICRQWNENSQKIEIIKDDITNKEYMKCCFTQVREVGEIEQCKYIEVKE